MRLRLTVPLATPLLGLTTTVYWFVPGIWVTEVTVPCVALKLAVLGALASASLKLTTKLMSALVGLSEVPVTAVTTGGTVSPLGVASLVLPPPPSAMAATPATPAVPAASVPQPKPGTAGAKAVKGVMPKATGLTHKMPALPGDHSTPEALPAKLAAESIADKGQLARPVGNTYWIAAVGTVELGGWGTGASPGVGTSLSK